jgi:hypothetical protein
VRTVTQLALEGQNQVNLTNFQNLFSQEKHKTEHHKKHHKKHHSKKEKRTKAVVQKKVTF